MLTGILLANGNISASILNSLFNENLVKEGELGNRRLVCSCSVWWAVDWSVPTLPGGRWTGPGLSGWRWTCPGPSGGAVDWSWSHPDLFPSGVSAAFAVKLFKSWINEKDINCVACSLRKVGMDNRLMVGALGLVRDQSQGSGSVTSCLVRRWVSDFLSGCVVGQ